MEEEKSLQGCTFVPRTEKNTPRGLQLSTDSFFIRNQKWSINRECNLRKQRDNSTQNVDTNCTFTPRISESVNFKSSGKKAQFDPSSFYNKNIKWVQQVAENAARKIAIMFPSEAKKAEEKRRENRSKNCSLQVPNKNIEKYVAYAHIRHLI